MVMINGIEYSDDAYRSRLDYYRKNFLNFWKGYWKVARSDDIPTLVWFSTVALPMAVVASPLAGLDRIMDLEWVGPEPILRLNETKRKRIEEMRSLGP